MGHKLADLREQGLLGSPNYNLTNTNNSATVGLRRNSTPCFSDTPNVDSSDDHQSPPSGNGVGPQRVRSRNHEERRGHAGYEPYSTPHHARSNRGNRSAAWNDTSTVKANHGPLKTTDTRLTVTQQRSNRFISSNEPCPNFMKTGILLGLSIAPLVF